MKTKLKNLLNKMIPIILGMLIALVINDWKKKMDDRKFIDKIMNSISEEMKENKGELEKVLREHQALVDTLTYYQDDESVAIGNIISKVKGFRGVNIKNTAWRTLTNSRLDLMEYEKISILTNIDEGKDNMSLKLARVTDLFYSGIGSTEELDKEVLRFTVNDLLYTEEELIEAQEKFLAFE